MTASIRAPRSHLRLAVGVLLTFSLAACSSSAGATGLPAGSTASDVPTGTPVIGTAPSLSVGQPTPAPSGTNSTTDPAGDVTPGFIDIVTLSADGQPGSLNLSMTLADGVPTGSPAVGSLAYSFDLDTDGDGTADYTATLALVPGGGFSPTLIDKHAGSKLTGSDFPGTATVAGATIALTVRFEALGCPSAVGVRGASQQTKAGATTGDQVPDAPDVWVIVTGACPPSSS